MYAQDFPKCDKANRDQSHLGSPQQQFVGLGVIAGQQLLQEASKIPTSGGNSNIPISSEVDGSSCAKSSVEENVHHRVLDQVR